MDARNIFVRNIAYSANLFDLEAQIASVLHDPPVSAVQPGSTLPLNFDVNWFKPSKKSKTRFGASAHKSGTLVIPLEDAARRFLDHVRMNPITAHSMTVAFQPDHNLKNRVTEQQLSALPSEPYIGKEALEKRKDIAALPTLTQTQVQLGIRTRNGETAPHIDLAASGLASSCALSVDGEAGTLCIELQNSTSRLSQLSIRFAIIDRIYIDLTAGGFQHLLLQLNQPVVLESSRGALPADPSLNGFFGLAQAILAMSLEGKPKHRLPHVPNAEQESQHVLRHILISVPRSQGIDLERHIKLLDRLFSLDGYVKTRIMMALDKGYSAQVLQQVDRSLQDLAISVAFQAQVFARPIIDLHC